MCWNSLEGWRPMTFRSLAHTVRTFRKPSHEEYSIHHHSLILPVINLSLCYWVQSTPFCISSSFDCLCWANLQTYWNEINDTIITNSNISFFRFFLLKSWSKLGSVRILSPAAEVFHPNSRSHIMGNIWPGQHNLNVSLQVLLMYRKHASD